MPATDAPCHLDLLFSAEVVSLRDETFNRVIHASSKRLGTAQFDGILIGDPFSNSMEEVRWPGGDGDRPPSSAEALALVADCGDSGERVCALALQFDLKQRVARWARCDAEVATDCGIGGFVSARLRPLLDDEEQQRPWLDEYEEHGWSGIVLRRQGQSAVLASSGWGDGAYDAWWGMSESGLPVCLTIDFDVLGEGEFDEARLSLPLKRGTTAVPGLPAVKVKAGLFSRDRPKVVAARLPEGQYVYTRVLDSDGGVHAPKIESGPSGSMRIDLRAFPEGQVLLVRLVTGRRPMTILSAAR